MKTIYSGNGFCLTIDETGKHFFTDDASVSELARKIENPEDIVFDEHNGWVFRDGTELPWA